MLRKNKVSVPGAPSMGQLEVYGERRECAEEHGGLPGFESHFKLFRFHSPQTLICRFVFFNAVGIYKVQEIFLC